MEAWNAAAGGVSVTIGKWQRGSELTWDNVLKAGSKIWSVVTKLLCILLLSATLDKTPDPPVVKPDRTKATAMCADAPHAASYSAKHQPMPTLQAVFSSLACLMPVFESSAILSPDLPCSKRFEIWRASDSSPPLSNPLA